MSKQIEEHLTNKSLIALGNLTKLSKDDMVNNFVRNLAPKWKEGRQILYDLLINNDKWFKLIFTYSSLLYYNKLRQAYEIKLTVYLPPNKINKFCLIANSWLDQRPENLSKPIAINSLFRKHIITTAKIFETKEAKSDYINYETFIYNKYFYSERLIKNKI